MKTAFVTLIAAFLFATTSAAAARDGFYEQQLQAGKADFQAQRVTQAASEFRIAAFGFLDRPALLAEALARLIVAQNALGLDSDAGKTLDRFVEVEQRFSPYKNISLEPPVKTAFETFALKTLRPDALASLPVFRRMAADAQIRRIAALPERKRIAAYRELADREPKNPDWALALATEYASRDAYSDAIQWGSRALDLDPANLNARALLVHARASSRGCRDALALVTEPLLKERRDVYADQAVCLAELSRWSDARGALANVPDNLKTRPDVRRAEKLVADNLRNAPATAPPKPAPPTPAPRVASTSTATQVLEIANKLNHEGKFDESLRRVSAAVAADPGNRALRLAMLESAVLAKAFQTAAAQISSVSPLSSGEELYMFYASVALYETGKKAEAKPLMERARPHLVPNPMVNYYVRAVLG